MANARLIGLLLLACIARSASAAAAETIDLTPTQRSGWRIERLFAPITGLFMGGPSYWYGERTIEIDTRPPGASLDLFYVRENVQQRFERTPAPIRVRLPSRIDAGPRDSVVVRASLDGYRSQEAQIDVRSRESQLTIELAPLPNHVEAMTHTYLSTRGSLTFLTSEPARFRIHETSDGFSVVLTGTSVSQRSAEGMQKISSDNIKALRVQQLGEDVVVWVQLNDADANQLDLRSTQGYDAIRELHHFTVELVPPEGNAAALAKSSDALARVSRSQVFGCALEFDRSMRSQLDPEALNRALAPSSSFIDPYLRLVLVRLGEISPDGQITLVDGSKFRPSIPLDLIAARTQSAEAVGMLSLLRAFIAELEPPEYRRGALRGVIAPELDDDSFDAIAQVAEDQEQSCRAHASASLPKPRLGVRRSNSVERSRDRTGRRDARESL
jgi:hypothetical protein